MRKLSVNEYARELGKTPANVYQRIKKGLVKVETIEGKTFVIIDNQEQQNSQELLEQERMFLKELLKQKDAEIAELKKRFDELVKSKEAEISTLKVTFDTFTALFSRQIAQHTEAEIISTGKKKKKKKKH